MNRQVFFPERFSIRWLKEMYRSGEVTPAEVIDEILSRSGKYADYNIWIVKPNMELISPYLERLEQMSPDLPLWGIPFAVKDNIDLEGVPTTAACPAYSYLPKESATVVKKLIAAGAIPVGKTNLDQFATGLVGTRSPYGECSNALDPKMISGGSSSGSAVSVALGLTAFALGTDTAGSGRVPAMLNNLIGYKPPVGSWSTKGVVPACASLDCVTVFAGSMEEAEAVDSVARGFDKDCVWSRDIRKNPNCLPAVLYLPQKQPLFFGTWETEYRGKWGEAVARIERLAKKKGIIVKYIDYKMFQDAALILYEGAYVAERWEDLRGFVEAHPGETFPVTEQILRSGAREDQTAAKLFGNLHELQGYKHKAHSLLEDAVMIMPTAGGSFTRDQVRKDPISTNSKMGLYTNHCNLLDLAAVAIPEDTSDEIRPFGISVFGRFDREDLVCGFAEEFLAEETVPLAVCGLHKKGRKLAYQLQELGAYYTESTFTANSYRLYELASTPVKPGLMRVAEGGASIAVDLYDIPVLQFGAFLQWVKEPLVIGDLELADGRVVKGFLCQGYASETATDITDKGSF
ncbi:MAG: allophanate hydrolase [Acetatifactor sp.]